MVSHHFYLFMVMLHFLTLQQSAYTTKVRINLWRFYLFHVADTNVPDEARLELGNKIWREGTGCNISSTNDFRSRRENWGNQASLLACSASGLIWWTSSTQPRTVYLFHMNKFYLLTIKYNPNWPFFIIWFETFSNWGIFVFQVYVWMAKYNWHVSNHTCFKFWWWVFGCV